MGRLAQWRARMFHDAETVRVSQSRPAFTLRGHVGKVTALLPIAPVPGRFTHGTLVTGGADASIRVWDPRKPAASGAQLQCLRVHGGAVLALEQCVDKLVSGCTRGEVRLWAPYDAQRPSDDDITGVADAARRAPIGVTYALFQPLRVLCSFERPRSSGVRMAEHVWRSHMCNPIRTPLLGVRSGGGLSQLRDSPHEISVVFSR